jgi:hypothetical protein
MLQSLILIDALSSACWEKKKKKKEKRPGAFFPWVRGQTQLSGYARQDIHSC